MPDNELNYDYFSPIGQWVASPTESKQAVSGDLRGLNGIGEKLGMALTRKGAFSQSTLEILG